MMKILVTVITGLILLSGCASTEPKKVDKNDTSDIFLEKPDFVADK